MPAVTVQVLPPLHVPLHEVPQVPWQVLLVHSSEQLESVGSHPILVNDEPPQAARNPASATEMKTVLFTASSSPVAAYMLARRG